MKGVSRRRDPVESDQMPKRKPASGKAAAAPESGADRRDWPAFAMILCATVLAYLPALRGTLVWDDASNVTQPELQSLHGLWRIWFDLSLGAAHQ